MSDTFESEKFIRSQSVVARVVAGETLIVPIRGKVGDLASIYSFNGTGTLIWKLLAPKINKGRLTRVRLWESPDLYVDCYGDGAR